MYKLKLLFFFLVSNSITSVCAHRLSFYGEVARQTCIVSVSGGGDYPIVYLPAVAESQIGRSGAIARETAFTITLGACSSPEAGGQSVETLLMAHHITEAGNLASTGSAVNIAVQITTQEEKMPLNFSPGKPVMTQKLALDAENPFAIQRFTARYVSEAGVKVQGSVISAMHYHISYL
ncbi:MAG: Major fimbrial subunit SMF-1 [Candidatus Erwinia impunctatus]|nr:Major fimbrial subunit SMF-1 [Culicoides impunctatus]